MRIRPKTNLKGFFQISHAGQFSLSVSLISLIFLPVHFSFRAGYPHVNPPMSNGGGGKITPQSAFLRISLEPRKMQRCVFMTFPEYGPATKCCI